MAYKDGAATLMGYANSLSGSVYGTALDLTSYDNAKICAAVSENFSSQEVIDDNIGCGSNTGFVSDVQNGQIEYRVGLSGNLGFNNGVDNILAQFFGAEVAPDEQTTGEDDYEHVFTMATLANQRFGTFVYETGTASVIELVSTYTQRIQITMSAVQQYVTWSADLLANDAKFASPTNSNADLATLTLADDEKIFSACAHTFRLKEILDNGSDDALDSGDQFNIISYDLELETPLEIVPELTGGVCAAPAQSGAKSGTLTIGIKAHADNTKTYVPWKAGSYFACEIEFKGKQINAGVNKSFKVRIPKMKLVNSPGYSVSNPGRNPVNLAYTILESRNVIAGFTTKGPELAIINSQPGAYFA